MPKPTGRPPRNQIDMRAFRAKVTSQALVLYQQEGIAAVSMRRLAREVGSTPTTIYAHFDGKTDVLRSLWSYVLADLAKQVQSQSASIPDPKDRLGAAAAAFVDYWLTHPDHFRLVFMSNEVTRADVRTFVQDPEILHHFQIFADMLQQAKPASKDAQLLSDTLLSGLIGIVFCHNTIRDHPWPDAKTLSATLIHGLLAQEE